MRRTTPAERRRRLQRGSRRRRDLESADLTSKERAIAAAALAAFNDAAGTAYSLDAHLVLLVGRIFEHPELNANDHREIVEAVFREPWWSGRPGLAVIYGDAAQFERSLETWRHPSGGRRRVRHHADIADLEAKRDRLRAAEQSKPEEVA